MNECECRIEALGLNEQPVDLETGVAHSWRIVYCPTHEAAFRLARALADARPFLGVESPHAETEINALDARIAALLREIGR